ncbi:MAG: pectate lyase, partial [Streptomyces sp.]|nr:pectate lyase [Streptomyces sp.]
MGLLCVPAHADARDISRDTLPVNDGWASEGAGTTGGAAADAEHVYVVTDRAGLVAALDGGSATPKIIKIAG